MYANGSSKVSLILLPNSYLSHEILLMFAKVFLLRLDVPIEKSNRLVHEDMEENIRILFHNNERDQSCPTQCSSWMSIVLRRSFNDRNIKPVQKTTTPSNILSANTNEYI